MTKNQVESITISVLIIDDEEEEIRLYSVQEAARALGVCGETIRAWTHKLGIIPISSGKPCGTHGKAKFYLRDCQILQIKDAMERCHKCQFGGDDLKINPCEVKMVRKD